MLLVILLVTLVWVPLLANTETVRRQSESGVLSAAVSRECFDIIYRYTCEESTYAQDGADIALMCGPDYLPFAENYAATCIRGDDDEFCFHFFTETTEYLEIGTQCSEIINSTSPCPVGCHSILQTVVSDMGCCFGNIFNDRLSQLLLGQSVDVALEACDITARPLCDSDFSLEIPTDAAACTFSEFWSQTADYLCRTDVGQPYVNALLKNPKCTPIARHYANTCSFGTGGEYCLALFGTSFNPAAPTRTARTTPVLTAVLESCDNYSRSFNNETCPLSCKNALNAAIKEIGCCINFFNDTVNEILLPHFGSEVASGCGIKSPGICEGDIKLDGGGSTVATSLALWACVVFSLTLF